jgi:hypothetical protein
VNGWRGLEWEYSSSINGLASAGLPPPSLPLPPDHPRRSTPRIDVGRKAKRKSWGPTPPFPHARVRCSLYGMSELMRVIDRLVRAMPRNADIVELKRIVETTVASTGVETTPVVSTKVSEVSTRVASTGCPVCAARRAAKKLAQRRWRAKE